MVAVVVVLVVAAATVKLNASGLRPAGFDLS